jgi:phosphoesterase RecJ-like protein
MTDQDSSMYQIEAAKRFILDNDRFLVVSHVQPDGDAASSTIAMGLILKALNKTYTMANTDLIPRKFQYLSGYDQIVQATEELASAENKRYQHVIAVDCADYSRVGKTELLFKDGAQILNIDHHPTNDGYGSVRLIRPNAAATVEILYELVEALNLSWTRELADCIYTGLLTDTGGFRYSSTTADVMQVASKMLSYGVEGHKLAEHLLEKIAYTHILLLKRALATLSFASDNRISWIAIRSSDIAETKACPEDLEGIVNYPFNIEGVDVGLLFKEVGPETVKVSLRSNGNVNVAAFAKSLGGGGHIRAAGCTIQKSLSEAVPYIIELLKRQVS